MSDALLAIVTAVVTTIGLAIVNKMMSRPSEHWKQASEMRGELRADLARAHEELIALQDRSKERDLKYLELNTQIVDVTIKLRNVSEELKHCLESHKTTEYEFERVRKELKTCIKAGGSA